MGISEGLKKNLKNLSLSAHSVVCPGNSTVIDVVSNTPLHAPTVALCLYFRAQLFSDP